MFFLDVHLLNQILHVVWSEYEVIAYVLSMQNLEWLEAFEIRVVCTKVKSQVKWHHVCNVHDLIVQDLGKFWQHEALVRISYCLAQLCFN